MCPLSKLYPVNEIFESIQGEGIWTGIPSAFVRLQECNLRCHWCDTKETWSGKAKNMTSAEILSNIHFDHVIITGGEPLLHDLTELFELLQNEGKKIHVETNGTQPWKDSYSNDIWITASPKSESGFEIHPSLKGKISEYKFVVDEDFTADIIENYSFDKDNLIFLSPENVRPEMIDKAMKIVFQYPFCRLMLQMHKLIGVK